LLAILAVGVLTVAAASGAGARPTARLALVKASQVTVSGHGFRARARVHVILVANGTASRRPLTNRYGAFTATFAAALDRCSGWRVTAIQSGRAPVILRSPPKPECAPL
jgi:hypothetical protein